MSRFFLDASALVKYYNNEPHSDKVRYLLDEKLAAPAQFFVPNVAILETVGTFYRTYHIDKTIPLDLAKSLTATFLKDLANGKFSIYSLKQSHINEAIGFYGHVFETHRIFQEMSRSKQIYPCSSNDLLMIAMTKADMEKNGKDVFLITNDRQMSVVAGKVGMKEVLLESFGLKKFQEMFPPKLRN